MDKFKKLDECTRLYEMLVWSLVNRTYPIFDLFYVRDLMKTEACDSYHDLSELRAAVRKKTGDEVIDRAIGKSPPFRMEGKSFLRQELEDQDRITTTVNHYRYWHRTQIMKCLPWSQWLYYKTIGPFIHSK